uniref:Serine hydrolase FSH domain-containing protein n=1 Tax=Romanomermis culicivorax TaxID=13658 RepID=A0A915JI58_ROMCU
MVTDFISAPHLVPQAVNDGQEDDSANNGTEDQRTWFNFHENPNLFIDRTNFLDMYVGFDETQILLKKTIEENYKFRFVILISGLMKSEAVQKFLVEHAPKFRVRSLHIMGSNDNVVSNDKSRAVLDLFENAILYVHSGGHFVPTSGPNRKEFYEIFDKFIFSDDGCVQSSYKKQTMQYIRRNCRAECLIGGIM